MLEIFHGPFHAAAVKQPGFIDVQMYKLRSALQGSAPPERELQICAEVSDRRAASSLGGHADT